jgi:tRNA-Thr(GGU) m(6)t(6)A37 methyltransferase TsaA
VNAITATPDRFTARSSGLESHMKLMDASTLNFALRPIGRVHSTLKLRASAPCQAWEGAPDAELEIDPEFVSGLRGVQEGQYVLVLTWLHEAERTVLEVHPRGDRNVPLAGVFATRSPDRPNPIGLHRVKIRAIDYAGRLKVGPLEAIDGTPVLDIKPVLDKSDDA